MKNTALLICFLIIVSAGCNLAKSFTKDAGNVEVSGSQTSVKNIEKEPETSTLNSQTASVTGTYESKGGSRSNEIKVLQISDNIIKVSFLGNYEFESQSGPMANSGVISAQKIQLENGHKALLNYEDAPDCNIILTFKGNRLEVEQNKNDCGFPSGVVASGSYKKTSSKEPIFDFDEGASSNSTEATLEKQTGNVKDDTAERIRFPKGASSATVPGKITEGRSVSYLIGARAGQTMEIKVVNGGANKDVVFDVIAPDGTRLGGDRMYDDWSRKLPKSGNYLIQVSTFETENTSFKLKVTIR